MKVCGTCKETKPFDMFYKCKSYKDGLQNKCISCEKDYYQANRNKHKKSMASWYKNNKEKQTQYAKAYYEANKEKIAEKGKAYRAKKGKAYYEANKDKILEQKKAYKEANKEKIAEKKKAYRARNKDKVRENKARRRAMKRNAIPKFLRNCGVEKQRLRDIYKLSQLFSEATGIEHHVDHMWPLSKGGPHWSGNLQILTATENLSKYDKLCKTLKKNIKASLEIARKEYVNDEDNSNRH